MSSLLDTATRSPVEPIPLDLQFLSDVSDIYSAVALVATGKCVLCYVND